MTDAGYVFGAWALVAVVLLIYAVRLVRRERVLLTRVPRSRARWMSSEDPGPADD